MMPMIAVPAANASPATTAPAIPAPTAEPPRTYPEMRVLNDAFWERLGRVNTVSRRVAALGWRAVRMDALTSPPTLRVEPRADACPQPLPQGLALSGILHDHAQGLSHAFVDGVRLTWPAADLEA